VTENVMTTVWEAVMGTNWNTKPNSNISSIHHPFSSFKRRWQMALVAEAGMVQHQNEKKISFYFN